MHSNRARRTAMSFEMAPRMKKSKSVSGTTVGADVALEPPTRTAPLRRAMRRALSCSKAVYCRIG